MQRPCLTDHITYVAAICHDLQITAADRFLRAAAAAAAADRDTQITAWNPDFSSMTNRQVIASSGAQQTTFNFLFANLLVVFDGF